MQCQLRGGERSFRKKTSGILKWFVQKLAKMKPTVTLFQILSNRSIYRQHLDVIFKEKAREGTIQSEVNRPAFSIITADDSVFKSMIPVLV